MTEFQYESEEETEVFEYLDDLRESGVVNMFGATSFLQGDLGLTKSVARGYLVKWMETFGERYKEV